jgi:hypothetical protein
MNCNILKWESLTQISVDSAELLHRTPAMARAIALEKNTAEAQLMAAYQIDPTIITEWRRYYVDVNITLGMTCRFATQTWLILARAAS